MTKDTFDIIFGVILSFIICFGVTGNVLSFIIWTKGRRCKKCPGGIFLRALDLADTFVLLLCATDKAMSLLGTTRLRKMNTFFCKLHKAGWHFGLLVSTWIVVCFTVERTIVLGQPRKAAIWTGRGKSIGMILTIFIISILLNIPWAISSDIMTVPNHIYVQLDENFTNATRYKYDYLSESFRVEDHVENVANTNVYSPEDPAEIQPGQVDISSLARNSTNIVVFGYGRLYNLSAGAEIRFLNNKRFCGCESSTFISRHERAYHFWFIDFVLIFSLPFTIILICNATILLIVVWRRKNTRIRRGSLVQNVTARAVAVSVVHCISTGPFSISILVPGFYKDAFIGRTGPPYYIGIITVVFSYVNNGVNFILYSFFGTDFRRDCADLLRRKSRVMPKDRPTVSATRTSNNCSYLQLCNKPTQHQHHTTNASGTKMVSSVSAKVHISPSLYESEA